MSDSTPSVPPGRPAAARNPGPTGGRLFAFLCWLVLLPAVAVLATASFIRAEHREAVDRRYALADEQRSVAAAAGKLVEDLAGGPAPAVSRVSALRARSLELLALVPLRASAELQAEWGRLAASLGAIEAEWARILTFRTGLEALRHEARVLREGSDRLAEALSARDDVLRGGAEALAVASRQLSEEVDQIRLADPSGLDRARSLLDVHARVRRFLAAGLAAPPAGRASAPDAELASVGAQIGSARGRLEAILGMAGELGAVPEEVRRIAASSARVAHLLPEFEARSRRSPVLFGASLDAWIVRSAALALAALLGLLWRRLRLLRAEASELDRAWGEAAGSDWRARGLVRDLLRAIYSLDRKGAARGAPADPGELEGRVREATASLPRIVARRSRLAAALLSAHDSLRERLAAARSSALAYLDRPGAGEFDTAPLLKIEAALREATLFAMAALAGEIRAAASEPGPQAEPATGDAEPGGGTAAGAGKAPSPIRSADGPETVQDTVARAFDLLDAGLERVLAGEEEGNAAFIFLLDDLRTVQGKALFSSSLDFAPDLAFATEAGTSHGAVLRSDAARVLPSFRKGLAEWTANEGPPADSATKLVRGSVSVLARSAEEGRSPAQGFWSAAAAFCIALCEHAIPDGPTIRRIMGEVAREFDEAAGGEAASAPSEGLLRELLIYVALAESDHEELEGVRTAFGLERYPLAVPEQPGEMEAADDDRTDGGPPDSGPPVEVSEEIIQQLEGIKAALDRVDDPSGASPGPSPPR